MQMTLFIDGDALPNILKPILLNAINRLKLTTFVVSNKRIYLGESTHISYIIVGPELDEADRRIVLMAKKGDLVITADIPLADHVITKGAHAIDHRGKFFDSNNIKNCLAMRDLMQGIRETSDIAHGPAPFSQKDAHKFANQLNAFLTKQQPD